MENKNNFESSVPSNIAEGFERQTNKEFIQFLFIAKGSCGELRTQLYLAKELKYIDRRQLING
jgi:four helix bundle protein